MNAVELDGFRRMQGAFREPLVVPTFLVACLAMSSFFVWDLAREGGWGAGASTRVAGACLVLACFAAMRSLWRPSVRIQSLVLYAMLFVWQLAMGTTFGEDTLLQFPGLLIIMFSSVIAIARSSDAWVNGLLASVSLPFVVPPSPTIAQWFYVVGLYSCTVLLVWIACAQRERSSAVIFLSKSQWKRDAQTDVITGLANRRTFEAFMEDEAWRLSAAPASLTLAVIDIDHFKRINDQYGHDVGDEVLKGVSERLRAVVREVDLLARLGGEEFGLAMSSMPGDAVKALLERMRAAIASRPFVAAGQQIECTVSIGAADGNPSDGTWDVLYQRADKALYEAKARGRNRIVVTT